MKKLWTSFLVILTFLALSTTLTAQTGVGKLAGKITDAQTGEALIGANVVILDTEMGAATDVSGDYYILNITPGTYSVKVSYVGYTAKTITNVRVVAGITYELNVQLESGIELKEVVVESQANKFFESKSTNTTKVFDADDINKLPVKGVGNLASLNAGVVISDGSGGETGNASINIRGGRGGEVLYIVDGVPQNDLYTGSNYSQVSDAAIEQISFQIGGYEAKYGQAQSGIINVTTKSGSPKYSAYFDVLTSSFTDDYESNLYTGNLSGPIIPGDGSHTFFLSAERGWYLDQSPKYIGVEFQTTGYESPVKRDLSSGVWRFTGRTKHIMGDWQVRLGANINERDPRGYVHSYQKNNWMHQPRIERTNYSFSGKVSQNITANSFWNLNVGYRLYKNEQGDGVYFDDLYAYGDSSLAAARGVTLPYNGGRVLFDDYGIFSEYGRVNNGYFKTENNTITMDLDFTTQMDAHLLEAGGGFQYSTLRYFAIGPIGLSSDNLASLTEAERFRRLQPTVFGFDITGSEYSSAGDEFEPKNPVVGYAYLQDRFELSDMVLNLGIRLDYFDTQAEILRDPLLPYAFGDPNEYDAADFITKDPDIHISPRIGIGFPVTESTVFHAQYGKFVQHPPLDQLYTTVYDLNFLITDNNWSLNTGHVESEITTQYEIGFRQVLGDNLAAVNFTLFYKNTEGLLNTAPVFFQRQDGGQTLTYITPTNTDFGTIKGVALSVDVTQISYFGVSLDYTYSVAEGTGSSQTSSFTAAFRNAGAEIPKVIAPLEFDQRHTGTINVDFSIPRGELGLLEMLSANALIRFNSGRPYTPLESQNLTQGATNYGNTRGYVNSAYAPGNFRVDLKIEKSFSIGSTYITPYIWVENLFDAENPVTVYQSTGDPYTTGYIESTEGQKFAQSVFDPEGYIADYKALERDPFNFGIPRLIKVGLKVNFSQIAF